jgi:hypothetical protein
MERKFKNIFSLLLILSGVVALFSCDDMVTGGLRPEYGETDAKLQVTAVKDTFGITGDTIQFAIHAESNNNIRAFAINAQYQGESGTKFSYTGIDPFIDHSYGTIQNNIKSFDIVYSYVIPANVNKVRIEFTLTDEVGKKTAQQTIALVNDVEFYQGIVLHSSNNFKTDGFSSFNGVVYQNLKNNEATTETNREVQENLDIVFLTDMNTQSAKLAAPAYGGFSSGMAIKNKTNFLLLEEMNIDTFDAIRAGTIQNIVSLTSITETDSYSVEKLKVGDFVGFVTDYNASNSYKIGVLHITSLHKSSCEWYEGTTYSIEFDAKVEVSK